MNGLTVSAGFAAEIHVRHTGNIVDSVLKASFELLEHGPKILDAVKVWQNIQLTEAEQSDFARAAHTLRYKPDSNTFTALEPQKLLEPRRIEDNKPDLWSTFNRIQENVMRGGQRADFANRRNRTRGIRGIDEGQKLNKALWQLADDAAKLKLGL